MSAYMVSKEHVIYLARAGRGLSYGDWLGRGNYTAGAMAGVATRLWAENLISVEARYPGDTSADSDYIVTPEDVASTQFAEFRLAEVFKACACFAYQACESEDWESSAAHGYLDVLRAHYADQVAGYEAAPWGCPDPIKASS